MPASTSGRSSAMKAVEWQPGLAMRLALRSASRWPGASSGMPKTQPGATRCAVLASMRQVFGLVTSATASLAAASGRHRKATSAALSRRARSAGVLALVGVDAQHLDVAARGQVLVDAQAGGAFLAVDEHDGASSWGLKMPA